MCKGATSMENGLAINNHWHLRLARMAGWKVMQYVAYGLRTAIHRRLHF